MDYTTLIITGAVIVALFLAIKFFMKTFKIIALIAVAAIIFGVWLYGYSGFFDKVSDVKNGLPEIEMPAILKATSGCTSDMDCAYVIESSDCRLSEGHCNNIAKEENYQKIMNGEVTSEACNKTSIVFDPAIECACKLDTEVEGELKSLLMEKIEETVGYRYCQKK